jgi:hypothetical protein
MPFLSNRLLRRPCIGLAGIAGLAAAAICVGAPTPLTCAGPMTVDSSADGGLRPVVGVVNLEVVRANRTNPEHADGLAHTYLHQPMLALWRGRFYLEYLSGPRDEHQAPCVNSLTTSADGRHWDRPRTVFPSFQLPDGSATIAHQRMGFFVAPDGRLLVLGFYGKAPAPNDGTGIGRAVREIRADGSFGLIYFIRLNRKQPFPGFTPPFPLYAAAPDAGFVAACDALLSNKLMTAQWWEEDQLDDSDFYTIKGKALSFVHRPDGSVLGMWKNALVATTGDEGRIWTEKQFGANLPNNTSKYWVQRTSDGRFALVLNPTNRQRLPLAVMTSTDCATFSDLLTVHGEVPDQRFNGRFKNLGPQYVRGIVEGNGTPPDGALWIAYSVNKEDIWVSRVPVPIASRVDQPANDTFESCAPGSLPPGWNLYVPRWASIQVVDAVGADSSANSSRALELRNEEPYDYARAVRVFPETHGLKLSFRVLARQTTGRIEIDLLDARGARPFQFALREDGHIWVCHEGIWNDNGPYTADRWVSFAFDLPKKPTSDRGNLLIDGHPGSPPEVGPTEAAATVERLSFRTGPFRRRGEGSGRDLPHADERAPAAAFLVDDVVIEPQR